MFEEKESFWKKKGFYLSACVLLVCVMAVGAIFYRKTNLNENESNMMANIATEVPSSTANNTGNSAISSEGNTKQEEAAQANAKVAENITSQKDNEEKSSTQKTEKDNDIDKKKTTKNEKKETTAKSNSNNKSQSVSANTNRSKYSFDEEKGLLWPVKGDVILKYSMNNAIYFKTLAQYKCNPGIAISAKVGTKVKAAADCQVTKIEKNDELGTVITTDIGDKYSVLYGQLDNISVNKGDELKEGDVIGTVAKPTKYYTEEGSNLYLQVIEGKESVDPMLLLR